MSWVRIDDGFLDHPRIKPLSDRAVREFLSGLSYSMRYLTDGHVPDHAVRNARAAVELDAAGLWLRVDGGWHVHDWKQWNPTADEIRQRREKDAERKRRQRRGDDGRFSE